MSETVASTQGLPSHIRPGLIVAGKYRLEAEIGRGSMGTVYRAVHVTLGKRVAIKLISAEHLPSTEARKRLREAIVGFRKIGLERDRLFIVGASALKLIELLGNFSHQAITLG